MSEPTELLDESPEVEALGGAVSLSDLDGVSASPEVEVVPLANLALVEGAKSAWAAAVQARQLADQAEERFLRASDRAQDVLMAALEAQGRECSPAEAYTLQQAADGGVEIKVERFGS